MAGNKNFMASSYQFAGEKERQGYVKASKGDRRVQGVIDYKNQDLYSFGGKRPITRAYREASNDLNDVACQGKYYFETVKSKDKDKVYDKEYHEEVNDYTKNISQAIFFPSMSLEQYKALQGQEYQSPAKRSQSAGRLRRSRKGGESAKKHHRFNEELQNTMKAHRQKTVEREKQNLKKINMQRFNPCRPNAVIRKPDGLVTNQFLQTVGNQDFPKGNLANRRHSHRVIDDARSTKSAQKLRLAVDKERKTRQKLQNEVDQMKTRLNSLYDTMSNKNK